MRIFCVFIGLSFLHMYHADEYQEVKTYFEHLQTLQAEFQENTDQEPQRKGQLYLSRKEKKMRVIYNGGQDQEIILHNATCIYREGSQISYMDIDHPLQFLLTDTENMWKHTTFHACHRGKDYFQVDLLYKNTQGAQHIHIRLVFNLQPFMLQKWTLYTAQAQSTVTFSDMKYNMSLPKNIFDFKDPRLQH